MNQPPSRGGLFDSVPLHLRPPFFHSPLRVAHHRYAGPGKTSSSILQLYAPQIQMSPSTSRPHTSPRVKGRWTNRCPAGLRRPGLWAGRRGRGWEDAVLPRRRRQGGRINVTSGRKARLHGKSCPKRCKPGCWVEAVSSGVSAGLD